MSLRFHTSIDLLNSYMDEYNFPQPLRNSLRMYFIHCRSMRREERFKSLMDKMSPELQGLVTSHCYSQYITCVPFFNIDLDMYSGYKRVKVEDELKIFITAVGAVYVLHETWPELVVRVLNRLDDTVFHAGVYVCVLTARNSWRRTSSRGRMDRTSCW